MSRDETTSVPTELPVVPHYGTRTLADLLPSIAHQLGHGGEDRVGIGPGERFVVLLIDGLGTEQLEQVASRAPFLAGALRRGGQVITAAVPSTTVTSLTSLGTGLPPGEHGAAGFTFWLPEEREVVAPLFWESALGPLELQPRETELQRLAASGVAVSSVLPSRFENSVLTVAGLRGGDFVGVAEDADSAQRIEAVAAAATRAPQTLVYAYERELDHCGHAYGWQSEEWLECLIRIDRWASWLRAELPEDVRLIITGDHGMVDVPAENRLLVQDEPGLLDGVHRLAGEGRFRQIYLDQGVSAVEVGERWARRLGERAWVRTRDEAVEDGWLGELDPRVAARFGDVLVAMAGNWAVMTREMPGEFGLVGMHGSLTAAEMLVPLLQP